MFYYDRIDVSEVTQMLMSLVHLKKVLFVVIPIFQKSNFKFLPSFCTGCHCHDILLRSSGLKSLAMLKFHGANYCYIIVGTTKNEK